MKTLFKNFNLIDGTGNETKFNQTMLVENGIIVSIGNDIKMDEDTETVDLTEKYVIPGLIDCHTHLFSTASANPMAEVNFTTVDYVVGAIKNLKSLLEHGVVYIRDVGDKEHMSIHIKKHVQSGAVIGPDIHSSGKLVTMTGGHGHSMGREADGTDEVRKAVREQLKAGADAIKVMSTGGVMTPGVDVNVYQFNVDELSAAVEEAHKAGKKVATHAHGTQGIKNAVIAGIDSIEHASVLDDEAIDMIIKNGTYVVPTLTAPYYILENGAEAGIPQFMLDKTHQIVSHHASGLKKLYDKGGNIAMGTDSGTPFNYHGPASLKELELMVDAGISPLEVIKIATKNSSELIGINDKYGTLETGKFANFIVLSSDPTCDIKTVKNMENVYKKGTKIK